MNSKKFLLTMGLLPLVVAPVAVVASCSTTATTDAQKAMLNNQIFFSENVRFIKGFLPDQKSFLKGIEITQDDGQKKTLKFTLDPRQNYGFKTEIVGEEDNNDSGTKKVTLKLTRGNEQQTQVIELKDLLTNQDVENEKDEKLNFEEVFKDSKFNREVATFNSIGVSGPTPDETPDNKWPILSIEKFLKKTDEEITEEYRQTILGGKPGLDFKISNLRQKTVNGIKINEIIGDIRLIKKEADGTIKKSGIYNINFYNKNFKNVRNGLRTEEYLRKYGHTFSTFNTPMNELTEGNFYSQRLASEFEVTDPAEQEAKMKELLTELKGYDKDTFFFKKWPMFATLKSIGKANDSEGSLEVTFEFQWQDDKSADSAESEPDDQISLTPIPMNLKLYGFKVN